LYHNDHDSIEFGIRIAGKKREEGSTALSRCVLPRLLLAKSPAKRLQRAKRVRNIAARLFLRSPHHKKRRFESRRSVAQIRPITATPLSTPWPLAPCRSPKTLAKQSYHTQFPEADSWNAPQLSKRIDFRNRPSRAQFVIRLRALSPTPCAFAGIHSVSARGTSSSPKLARFFQTIDPLRLRKQSAFLWTRPHRIADCSNLSKEHGIATRGASLRGADKTLVYKRYRPPAALLLFLCLPRTVHLRLPPRRWRAKLTPRSPPGARLSAVAAASVVVLTREARCALRRCPHRRAVARSAARQAVPEASRPCSSRQTASPTPPARGRPSGAEQVREARPRGAP
jgi:hypothetical protein